MESTDAINYGVSLTRVSIGLFTKYAAINFIAHERKEIQLEDLTLACWQMSD